MSDITPRANEILKTMKEFNVETDKFLLSVEKVETALMQIEDDNHVEKIIALLNDSSLEELQEINKHISILFLGFKPKKPKFTIPNDQLETEERGIYRPLTDFEGMN